MTRAVCHLADPWPRPRTSRTIALAARAAVGPAARRSAIAASTAASSAASPSTTSWTSPIRCARIASKRRPPGNSARAWVSPILAITNGLMTAGRMPRRVSVNPNRVPLSAMTEVGDRAEPHAAAERRAVDPGDDRHGAGVDGLEHVGHGHRVLLVALDVERHGGAHPGDVGAGAERRPVAREDDGAELGRALARKRRESGSKVRDQGGVEGVVDVRPGERHTSDDPSRARAIDAQCRSHAAILTSGQVAATLGSMGPPHPWSPNWRPDPSGRRLAAIRMARRGGLLAAVLFAPVGAAGMAMLPAIEPLLTPPASVLAGLAGIAGVALLGAGLAPAALGSRIDGAVVGLALGLGVPVAAVTSALIGTYLAGSAIDGFDEGGRLAGQVLRSGVSGAIRLSPLIGLASVVWVVMVRRWGAVALPQRDADR